MNDDAMKYRSSDGHPLSAAQIARLDGIEARAGDGDDIPETSDAAWATAVRGRFASAVAAPVAVRLDADVSAWLRSQGTDPGATINRILRERMRAEKPG
jgi:uncharacterized protein (DUF4415 family)